MAATADAAKADGFMKSCVKVFDFRLPVCRPSPDFKNSLKSSSTTEESQSLLETLTQLRLDMINNLYNSSTFDVKIESVNNYIVPLFRFYDGLNATEKLHWDRELLFEWRGSITDKGECFKSSDILFEILMVLHTKAILHNNAAKALLDVDPTSFLSDAGKHMMEASGIMMTMSANIKSGAWGGRLFRKNTPNPPEVSEYACNFLALLFKGQAQQMSVAKSLTTGGAATPSSIKAKIAVGVVNSMQGAFDSLINVSADASLIYAPLLTHVTVVRMFYTAVAYQCAAQNYMEKKEVGNAIAYCLQAKARLVETKSTSKPIWITGGLPKFVGAYVELGLAAQHMTIGINQIQADCERDNKFVYFQQIPGNIGSNTSNFLPLPELPGEASVMNPQPWKEPDRSNQPHVLFTYVPKPSIFTSMFSGLLGKEKKPEEAPAPGDGPEAPAAAAPGNTDGTSSAPSAPSAPPAPGVPMYDAAYAAQLQKQYEAERAAAALNRQISNNQPLNPQQPGGQPSPGPRYNSYV